MIGVDVLGSFARSVWIAVECYGGLGSSRRIRGEKCDATGRICILISVQTCIEVLLERTNNKTRQASIKDR